VAKQKELQIQIQRVSISRGHLTPATTMSSSSATYSSRSTHESEEDLVMWDPVRDDLRTLPWLRHWCRDDWTTTLVCAVAGCDHLDCARGPFRAVFVAINKAWPFVTSACVYSSEAGAWSECCGFPLLTTITAWHSTNLGPSALVGNVLFFRFGHTEV